MTGSLRGASINHFACLLRHWTWADEAMGRFEKELTSGWRFDDETLRRLRRVHEAFGDALREEQSVRALEFLDVQER